MRNEHLSANEIQRLRKFAASSWLLVGNPVARRIFALCGPRISNVVRRTVFRIVQLPLLISLRREGDAAGTIVCMITGAGTGIGRATALMLAKQQAALILCGRRLEPLQETARMAEELGGRALALQTDVRDAAQVKQAVETAVQRFGRIDALVNNAGIGLKKPLLEMTEAEWNDVMDTNLKSAFLCSRAVLPAMSQAGHGVIVNVSSVLGKEGIADMSAYCAAKFGMIGVTESLARELRPRGIRVYAVCPDGTYTDLHRQLVGDEIARTAMPPEKVAARIVRLVNGQWRLKSGRSIRIDRTAPQWPEENPNLTLIGRILDIARCIIGKIGQSLAKVRQSLT
jgi:3-oxoacyl-[acyl-carrier protein] reductase